MIEKRINLNKLIEQGDIYKDINYLEMFKLMKMMFLLMK